MSNINSHLSFDIHHQNKRLIHIGYMQSRQAYKFACEGGAPHPIAHGGAPLPFTHDVVCTYTLHHHQKYLSPKMLLSLLKYGLRERIIREIISLS